MKRIYSRIMVGVILLLSIAIALKLFTYFKPFPYAGWWKYIMKSKLKYEFCKYNIPINYEFVEFYDSGRYPNALVIWQNSITGQNIILFRLRTHLRLDIDNVIVSDKKIIKPRKTHTSKLTEKITSYVYVPFFTDAYPQYDKSGIELRGFEDVDSPEITSASTTEIYYFQSKFNKIGIYKPKKGTYKYESYIFDFINKQQGTFAVTINKTSGDAILAMSFNDIDKKYDNQAFISFLKSVKFETEPFEDPFKTFTYRYKYTYR